MVCECFSCVHLCAPHVCLVPTEVKGHRIPLELEFGMGCEPSSAVLRLLALGSFQEEVL